MIGYLNDMSTSWHSEKVKDSYVKDSLIAEQATGFPGDWPLRHN